MPFTLIKGTFHVVNYSPDGDSIRFRPNNASLVTALAGSSPKFNARGHVQLRIEAIDALETHYSPGTGGAVVHQPLALAHQALDDLLQFLNIGNVRWDTAHNAVIAAEDGSDGYILARTVEKNGRPVAFVFAGPTGETDGASIMLTTARLRQSYNFRALSSGLAYPTFYQGLFRDLRDELAQAATAARQANSGVYAIDRTNGGFDADSLHQITQVHAILPKLFRRLAEFMIATGSAQGFVGKLASSKEPVLDLTTSNFTHFDTFVSQTGNRIHMTRLPEELVFDEMPARPTHAFSNLLEPDVLA